MTTPPTIDLSDIFTSIDQHSQTFPALPKELFQLLDRSFIAPFINHAFVDFISCIYAQVAAQFAGHGNRDAKILAGLLQDRKSVV